MSALTVSRAGGTIALCWLGSLVLTVLLACGLFLAQQIELSTLTGLLDVLADDYAPLIGVILAFYLTVRKPPTGRRTIPASVYRISLVLSIFWNLLVVVTMLAVAALVLPAEAATEFLQRVPSKVSWVVAPVLGYFFGTNRRE